MTDMYSKVKQIIKVYEQGVTMPLLCALEPHNSLAVVKYPFNPLGNHVLINEWIAHNIAKEIQAPVPEFGCCILDEKSEFNDAFSMTAEFDGIYLDKRNYGCCFFSAWLQKVTPMKPVYLPVMQNADEFDVMLLLDYIVGNVDRHEGNILFSTADKKFYAIDYSNIFCSQRGWNKDTLKQEILKKDYLSSYLLSENKTVYALFWNILQYEKLYHDAQAIKLKMTDEKLKEIIDSIPPEWNSYITPEEKYLLREYLHNRIQNIDTFCNYIEQGRR